jgi:uncharacterized protein with HEPN domain
MSETREFLLDLLDEISKVEAFSREGEAPFLADERTQYAVMMAYARIGEIAKRLPQTLLDQRPEAEWRDVKGFRDVLLHRYDEINPRRVWIAVQKLPVLRAAVEALLEGLDDEPADG